MGADGQRWNAATLSILEAVAWATEAGHLVYSSTADESVRLAPVGDPLLAIYESKTAATAAAKTIAEAHGLPKPRGVADVAANPALCALTLRAGQTPTAESEN
jgi:hypothetical protein